METRSTSSPLSFVYPRGIVPSEKSKAILKYIVIFSIVVSIIVFSIMLMTKPVDTNSGTKGKSEFHAPDKFSLLSNS